jgi:uncharacterized protein
MTDVAQMENRDVVGRIYEAFGRGDASAILEYLAEDVEWEYGVSSTDVPWLRPRRGRDEVPAFFEALAGLDLHRFEPKEFCGSGEVVVALVDLEATVEATGRRIVEEDEVHIWRFRDGKVARFRHRVDTHQHQLAYRG